MDFDRWSLLNELETPLRRKGIDIGASQWEPALEETLFKLRAALRRSDADTEGIRLIRQIIARQDLNCALRRFSELMDFWLAESGINRYQEARDFSLDVSGTICDAVAQFGEKQSLTPQQIADLQVGWSLDLDANGPEIAMGRLVNDPKAYLHL